MFEAEQIDLSMRNPDTGARYKANVYLVEGVYEPDGNYRQLSIGQLVMSVCLARATELERKMIELMEKMDNASRILETMTEIEKAIVKTIDNKTVDAKTKNTWDEIGMGNSPIAKGSNRKHWDTYLHSDLKVDLSFITDITDDSKDREHDADTIDRILTALETKMDEYNTQNQADMLEMQALTAKRDQTYDLNAALMKSFQTTIMAGVGNMAR